MSYEATPVDYNPFGGEGEKSQAVSPALEATPVEYDPFKEVSLSDSVGRGVDQMQGSFYGFAEATGELTGLDGVEAWGKEGRERNDKEAAAYGPAQQFTDIDSAGDAGQWVKEVFGSQLPMMAPALAGAAAGAAVGSVVPVLGTTVGGLIGAFIPSFMMNTGEIQGEIKERGGEAPGWAFAGGSAVAALDALLPVKFGSSLVNRFGKEAAEEIAETTLKKEVKSSAIKRAADGTISGIASEGITEAAQEAVGEFIAAHATNTPISDDLGKRMLEAGAAGALMGGAIGSASGVMDTPSVVPTIEEGSKVDPAPFHASEADVDDVAQQPFALEDHSTQALPEPPIYAQNETSEDVIYQGGATIPRLTYDHTVYEALPVGEVPLALPPSDVISGDGFTMGEQRIAPLDDAPNSSSVPMHNEQGERVGWFDMATGRAVADKGREAEVGVFEGQISRKIEPPYPQLEGPIVGDNFVMRDTDGVYSAPIGKPTVNDLEANLKDGRSQQEIDQEDLTNLRGLYSVAQRTRLAQSQRDRMRRLEKRLPDAVVQALRDEYSVNKPSDAGLGTEAVNTSNRNLLNRYGAFQAFLSHRRKRGAAGKVTPKMVMDQTGVAVDEARAMIARAKATGLLTAGGSQPTRKAPRDVFNIIREMGGMKLDGVYDGEIRQALSGRPGLISQRGIAADYVREHFEELGLLPVGSSTADMFNLIDQQANTKNKLFHPDDSDLVEAVEAQEIEAENARIKAEVTEQVQEWAEKLGERFTTDEIGSIVDDVLLNGKEIADAIVDEAENIAVRSEAFVSSYEPEYSIDIPFEGENNANQRTPGSAGRQNGEGIYGQEITSSSAQKSGEIAAPVAEDGGNFVEARRDYDGGPDDGNRTKARVPRTDTGPESSNRLNEKASSNGGFTVSDGSQSKPIAVSSKKDVERAASRSEGDTATPAQKEAENYRMGHIKLHGFDISIENGKGQKRTGHNLETGEQTWEVIMPAHYGRFKNTLGADGDHVDVYIGDNPKSEKVFIVDQVDSETGQFDEHKVMLGFDNLEQATVVYDKGFSDGKGPQRRENVASLSIEDFRTWLSDGDTKKPFWNARDSFSIEREAAFNIPMMTFKRGDVIWQYKGKKNGKPVFYPETVTKLSKRQNEVNGLAVGYFYPDSYVKDDHYLWKAGGTAEKSIGEYRKEQADKAKVDVSNKVRLSEAIDSSNKGQGVEFSDTDKLFSLDEYSQFADRLYDGKVSIEELKSTYERYAESKSALETQLNKLTVKDLLKYAGYTYKGRKKAEVLQGALKAIGNLFIVKESYSYNPFEENFTDAIRRVVDAQTKEDLSAFNDRIAKQRADYAERMQSLKKSIENPETLSEFKDFIRIKGRDSLSNDQKVRLDELIADRNRDNAQNDQKAKAKIVSSAASEVGMEIVEGKHTKHGHDIFTVKLSGERLEKEKFNELRGAAKRLNGYYSRYRGNGAVPGFIFSDRSDAERFVSLQDGAVSTVDKLVEKQETAQLSAVEKLRSLADGIEEKAQISLNQDRRTNTARQASMAASAEGAARSDMALAETMRNLAAAIESGEAKNLDMVRHKSHVLTLNSMARRAQHNWASEEIRKPENKYRSYEELSEGGVKEKHIPFAKMPLHELQWETFYSPIRTATPKSGYKRDLASVERLANKKLAIDMGNPRHKEIVMKLVRGYADDFQYSMIPDMLADYKRLQSMGIVDLPSLRATLREFLKYKGKQKTESKLQKLERALIGNKIPGFFPTPKSLIDNMVTEAGIEHGMEVLEPSAGKGDIADVLREAGAKVDVVEIQHSLREVLEEKGHNVVEFDFLKLDPKDKQYDRIVMNPPFEKYQDVEHVKHAYTLLKPGGRLVAIMSASPFNNSQKKAEDFRSWLYDHEHTAEQNPEGSFKGVESFRQTGVNTYTVVIDKSDTVDKPLFQRGKNGQGKVRRGDAAIEDDYTIIYPHDEAKFAKIAERVRDEVRRLAPQANTVIANSILEKATGEDVWGLTQNHKVFGKVIGVALYASQKDGSMQANPDVFGTIDHEVIHFLKGTGLFSESEWSVLSRAAQRWADKTKSDVGSRYSDHTQAQRNEEYVAHYFQEWASGKRHAGQTKLLDRLLTRLRNFFERLGNWLKGEGYQSLDDIFDRVSSGEVGKRATQKGGSSDSAPMYQRRTAPAHSFAQPNARIWEQLSDRNTALIDRLKSTTSHLIEEGRRLFQDKFLPLKRAQEAIEKARGKVLLDSENAYQAEELYHGRTGRKLEEFQDQKVEPLLEDIKDANLTIEEVEEYLYARHAHERNSQIAKINKEMPDSGSGMSNQEAAKLLSKWKDDARFQDLQAIASRVDAIVRDTQKARLNGGLIDLETLQAWNETYQSYVPLKGLAEEDEYHFDGGGLSVGKGFDIRGQESKRAMGRGHENRATDILANILTAYEEAVVRSEKNKVGQTFLNFALKNPDKTLWEVDKVEYEPKVSKASGMVYFGPKPGYQLADNVLAVKVDGEVHHITIHHEGIAKAMKNIGADTGNAFLRSLQRVNRFLAAINTSYNPEFIISNFSRDIQTAAINLQGFDVDGLTKNTMKNAWKAMKGIYAMERGKGAGDKWARHAEQFAKDGGQTKFFGLEDVEAKRAKLDRLMKDLDPSKPRKMFIALRSAEQWISDVNTSVENGVRLSAYVHLIDAGVTRQKAASIAKNLTVNFNRKGEYGSTLGAFYLFYNASIQGSVRLAQALKHSKRVRKTVVGLIGANVALELFNGFFSPEDEDGEKVYDKQTKFTKQHNIVFVNPWASATDDPLSVNAVTIPMPYGYNVFANIGRAIGEGVRFAAGNKADFKPLETSADLVALMFESFNPIGGESDLTRTFMPTLAKPTFELATNENFMGSPIMPEDRFGKETPDSEKSFKSVHPWLKGLASALNDLTGGNEVRPGLVDVSPETMEHMIEFVTGGTGKTVTRLTKLIHNGVTGEEIRTDDIPFVRKFLEGDSQYYRRYKFYDLRNAVQLLEREVKMLREAGRGDAAKRAIDDNRVEWRLRNFIKRTDRVLKPMRKRLNALNADERLNDTVKETRIKAIEKRMEREYERVIRQYIELLESSRNPH
ncbi:LPD38 domain-containing protein [Terasakiella pusilla]|uniref:LPD38 domain-containing protein n=1 Tax=Terasakiella pusilla TaxID=64973 RepID=UPI003AA85576